MKPFRGKRTGPQSPPSEFNLAVRGPGGGSDPSRDGPCRRLRPTGALSGGGAPRPSLGLPKPPWKVAGHFGGQCYRRGACRPARGARNPAAPALWLGPPALSGPTTGTDCSQCVSTVLRPGLGPLPSRRSRSVANRSAPRPTRLETRTKESNMHASRRVLRNP